MKRGHLGPSDEQFERISPHLPRDTPKVTAGA